MPVAAATEAETTAPSSFMSHPDNVAPANKLAPPVYNGVNGVSTNGAHGNARSSTSANAFASGSNQNAGNFITDRSTTRIAAPPGNNNVPALLSADEPALGDALDVAHGSSPARC